jgi:hypothetical protein
LQAGQQLCPLHKVHKGELRRGDLHTATNKTKCNIVEQRIPPTAEA